MSTDPASLPVRQMTHKAHRARRAADRQVESMIAQVLEEKEPDELAKVRESAPVKRCGKHIYSDKRHAQTAAKGLLRISPTGTMRAYQCPICDGGVWHLTSKLEDPLAERLKKQTRRRDTRHRRAVLELLRLEDEE